MSTHRKTLQQQTSRLVPDDISRRAALGLAAAGAAAIAAPKASAAPGDIAIKHYIPIRLKPGMDQLALDRWYMTFHAPQVRRAFKSGSATTSPSAPTCRRLRPRRAIRSGTDG